MLRLWPGVLAVAAAAVFGALNFERLPEQVATHWNLAGEADGWSRRTTAVWLLPGIAMVLAVVLAYAPRIDPKRENVTLHVDAWWLLANAVLIFLAVLHIFSLGNALGWPIPVSQVLGLGLGALLMLLGSHLTRVRQNWFLGIRTPWTLSSEKSWRETHRLGGRLLAAGGALLILVALITGNLPAWAVVIGVVVPTVVSLVYSYIVWRNDPATGGNRT